MDSRGSGNANKIRIVIVDDHQMVRQGLRSVLEDHPSFDVIGEAGDGHEAVHLVQQLAPDVIVMDVNMPKLGGIDATQQIIANRPDAIVIGLSFGSDNYVEQAMRAAGAVSCVMKERAVEDVCDAIHKALAARRGTVADSHPGKAVLAR